jgi:hypothetical protein
MTGQGTKTQSTTNPNVCVGTLVKLQDSIRFVGSKSSNNAQLDKDQIGIVLEIHPPPAGLSVMAGESALIQWSNGNIKLYSIKLLDCVAP